ncbi:MAG: DUF58 domain-containing protein [Candidatus Sedimenticola endophacoides]
MLIGSINYANNLGFLLTFLLTGLGVVAIYHTWANLAWVELFPGRCEPVFAGQQAHFEIRLENRRRTPRPGIQLQLGASDPATCDLTGQTTLILPLASTRRGHLTLPRFTLSTRYPMGLLRAWTYIELDQCCLVYPRPGPRIPAADTPDYSRSQRGDRGVGVGDFVGLRPYRDGDSIKHIHWKALARERGLLTKQFGGDRSERRWLDWDALAGLDTEQRLSALCRGVIDATQQQLEYGLRLPGTEIPPGRDPAHRQRCLRALALYGEQP